MPKKPGQKSDTEILERIDPEEGDIDNIDGDIGFEFKLEESTEDPERHYCYPHDDEQDVRAFKAMGYREERQVEGGVRLKGAGDAFTNGEVIKVRDHVLMSCDRSTWERRERAKLGKNAAIRKQLQMARTSDVTLQSRADRQ